MALLPGHTQYSQVFVGYFRFLFSFLFTLGKCRMQKISAVGSLADICFPHVLIRLIRCIIVCLCVGILVVLSRLDTDI